MSIVTEQKKSDTLVIAATGLANKMGLLVPDFFREAGLADCSKIVIVDPSIRLTLGGLPPEYPSFFDIVDHLQQEISRLSPEKLITTGTSGGAHTALLLGHLLKADYVVSFAPYPYTSRKEFKRMEDPALRSMRRVIERLEVLPKEVHKFYDLKDVLSEWNRKTQYYVHISRDNEWDYRRAMWLEKMPGLSVIPHPFKMHSISSVLAHHGKLRECFEFPYKYEINQISRWRHMSYMAKILIGKLFRRRP